MDEKRRFPRVSLVCKISASFAERLLVMNGHTENIGEGGIRVIIEAKLRESTPVDIELYIPDKEPILCQGKIVWVKMMHPQEKGPAMYNTGIEFVNLREVDRESIKTVLRDNPGGTPS